MPSKLKVASLDTNCMLFANKDRFNKFASAEFSN